MHEHHNRSVFDKSSPQPAGKLPVDAPRAIEVWCEICPITGFALRSVLIERGWDISESAFCPVSRPQHLKEKSLLCQHQ